MAVRPLLSIIAAMAENRVIGRDNALPWRLPADLAHFKRQTLDKPIVMGRRTWESLPGLLPRRRHVVITRDPTYQASGALVVHSIDEALAAASESPEVMVIGGADLYRQTLPLATRLYLTRVRAEVDGDAFFPEIDPTEWREVERVEHPADDANPFDLTFLTLQRAGIEYPTLNAVG
jgi:dihydrofolate reductase